MMIRSPLPTTGIGRRRSGFAVVIAFALAVLAGAAPPTVAADASLETMIGQMIMVGFVGERPEEPWPAKLAAQIAAGEVGGVLFLKRNIADRASVRALTGAFSAAGGDLPVLLAVDQEGGRVQRLTAAVGFPEVPSAREVAATLSVEAAEATYAGLARNLRCWGFNLNLGPVVDLDTNPANPIIGALGRSYAADPAVVAAYAGAFVAGHRAEGVLTALKHFPGHGSSRADSHEGFVDITDTWSPVELVPYRELIARGLVDMVMTGHLYLEAMSEAGTTLPASLSAVAIARLRSEIGFDGLVISDDMEMGAIEAHFSLEDAAVSAIKAGTNILIYSNYQHARPDLPGELIAILAKRAADDADLRARIAESYDGILALKVLLAARSGTPVPACGSAD